MPNPTNPNRVRLTNWSRTHTFVPQAIQSPASLEELLAIVHEAGRAGRTVKPAGSLHSWSACAVTDDVSVQMGLLNRVLETNATAGTVRVQAGMRMRDLYAHLEQAQLALPCLPNVDTIQVGGAIVNATHGTCLESGSMCSLVAELDIVVFTPGPRGREDGRAELRRLRRDTTDRHERHLFEAAVASFGSIGIVHSVTLRCVEPYHSYVHETVLPFDALQHRFRETSLAYYSVRFVWHPMAEIVFTKIQVPIHGQLVRARARSTTTAFDVLALRIIAFANERQPRRWHRLRRAARWTIREQVTANREQLLARHNKGTLMTWYDAELESRLHAVFVRRPFVNLEYAVPLDRFDEMVEQLRALFARYVVGPLMTLNFRPVGADDAGYLVASKGGPVVYVDIGYVVELEQSGIYADIERTLIALGGRCSWARHIVSEPEAFLQNYPEHHRFVAAKQELDPGNVFANAFSDRICAERATPAPE